MCGTQYKSDWLFITQTRVLQLDWMISNNDEKVTLYVSPITRNFVMTILSIINGTLLPYALIVQKWT